MLSAYLVSLKWVDSSISRLTASCSNLPDGLMKKVSLTFLVSWQWLALNLDFFFDHRRRLPTSNFILQDRRCREWSSPVSLFPARAGFTILVRNISMEPISGTHQKSKSTLPWRSRRLGKPFFCSLRPIVLGNAFSRRSSRQRRFSQ